MLVVEVYVWTNAYKLQQVYDKYSPNWAYRQEVLACSNLQSHHDVLPVARMLPAFFISSR